MHEVGIMEGALDMARRLMEKRGGNRLRRVHMTIGSLSGVVPDFSFTEHGYICPGCGEPALAILRGRELELTRVEWE